MAAGSKERLQLKCIVKQLIIGLIHNYTYIQPKIFNVETELSGSKQGHENLTLGFVIVVIGCGKWLNHNLCMKIFFLAECDQNTKYLLLKNFRHTVLYMSMVGSLTMNITLSMRIYFLPH